MGKGRRGRRSEIRKTKEGKKEGWRRGRRDRRRGSRKRKEESEKGWRQGRRGRRRKKKEESKLMVNMQNRV